MRKKYLIISGFILFILGALIGCSDREAFNDDNIKFSIINIQSSSENKAYTIEVTNETGYELTHLEFFLSYPIKTENGSESNPFVIEGKPEALKKPLNIKSGESIKFSIVAPIKKVFSNSNLLDLENPSVELKGDVVIGKKEIPFGMIGGLDVIVNH